MKKTGVIDNDEIACRQVESLANAKLLMVNEIGQMRIDLVPIVAVGNLSSTNQQCKVIVLGDSRVGKTALIHKFVTKESRADFKATVGVDISSLSMIVNGKQVDLQIWDTAGQERFNSLSSTFFRGTNIVILVYDITSKESFENVKTWRQEFLNTAIVDRIEDLPFIIYANKCDLEDERKVTEQEGEALSNQLGYPIMSVSAKTGQNVENGFKKVVELYLQYDQGNVQTISIIDSKLRESEEQKKCNC